MTIQSVLRIVLALVDTAVYAKDKYDEVRQKAGVMVKEGREPTIEEWAELNAVTKSNHERIQSS